MSNMERRGGLNKYKVKKKYLLFVGLIFIALGFFLTVVLISRRYDALWFWYEDLRQKLTDLEEYIMSLNKDWQFIGAILLLYIIKSFFPIYFTSTLCLISGVFLKLTFLASSRLINPSALFKPFNVSSFIFSSPYTLIYALHVLRSGATSTDTTLVSGCILGSLISLCIQTVFPFLCLINF